MNQGTSLSLAQSLQEIRHLLGDVCVEDLNGSSSFFEVIEDGVNRARELIQALIESAQQAAEGFKARAAKFWETIWQIDKAKALFASLLGTDHHETLTKILYLLGRHAVFRVPLFRYGPQLSEFRHRFR